jgi:hypothetical protein
MTWRNTILLAALSVTALAAGPAMRGGGGNRQTQVPTTEEDFFQPGSQPSPSDYDYIIVSRFNCYNCHAFDDDANPTEVVPPYNNWLTSMMAQSARDPVFHAAMTIANQDVNDAGELCMRCHMPGGWIQNRSMPSDGSALIDDDFDGVNCNFCHRMVDPVWSPENPVEDDDILQQLIDDGTLPTQPGNGRYIIDPEDTRRGPRADLFNMHNVPILESPYHKESAFCGTCHDLSNPVFSLQPDGTWAVNAMDAAHPTQNMYEMIPEQRTYSEWLASQFADGGVQFDDERFGGNHPTGLMQSCQDCHMPKRDGGMCVFWELPEVGTHEDVAGHEFAGVNSWVLGAVHNMYPSNETGLSDGTVALAEQRADAFLQAASDLDLSEVDGQLVARVTNWSGHKLPTGYPEGRRIWLNVRFLDASGEPVVEHGAYDWSTATLTEDTKVYEVTMGISETLAGATGLPVGETMHITVFDQILMDNRIPPVGFINAAFEAINAQPVAYTYDDGQHWDDSVFDIPADAVQAVVTVYHQTSTREYMEFLRDTNVTDDKGQIAYDQWVMHGQSAPVIMDSGMIELGGAEPVPGDVNGDGIVDVVDLLSIISAWGACSGCPEDVNDDGTVNVSDLLIAIANWS